MLRVAAVLALLVPCYVFLITPFSERMSRRSFIEKLGNIPEPILLRMAVVDQKQVIAAGLIFKTMMYYGGLKKEDKNPDYSGIERTLVAVTRLDPYNMDAYYFGQATLVWDMKHFSEANALLEYGMRYRQWDYYLPIFAGFNAAYFMKDYASAARYYRRAGEMTGEDLFMRLSGRYLYEIGQTEQAIAYLSMMIAGTRNAAVKESLSTRLKAFQAVREVEKARDIFQQKEHRLPLTIEELSQTGALLKMPADPYGGSFYIDPDGQVRSTSKFAPGVAEKGKQ